MINVQVDKTENESNASVVRRFTKRVQGAGILPRVRGIRFVRRSPSPYTKKKFVLRAIERRRALERLIKLGKAPVGGTEKGTRSRASS